jgi:hypothetical protein
MFSRWKIKLVETPYGDSYDLYKRRPLFPFLWDYEDSFDSEQDAKDYVGSPEQAKRAKFPLYFH